jgi:hypothetical protein
MRAVVALRARRVKSAPPCAIICQQRITTGKVGPLGKYRRQIKIAVIVVAAVAGTVLLPPAGLLVAFLVFVRALRGEGFEPTREPVSVGRCEVSPGELTAGGEPVPVRVTYIVGKGGIAEGGSVRLCPGKVLKYGQGAWQLRLQWGSGWGSLQRKDASRANYLRATTTREDVELSVEMMEKAMDRTQLMWLKRKLLQKVGFTLPRIDPRDLFLANHKVTVRLAGGSLDEGDRIEFAIGEETGLRPPLVSVGTDYSIELDGKGSGAYELEESFAHLESGGGRPARLDLVAPTLVPPGGKFKVLVRCLDENGVLSRGFSGRIAIAAEGPLEAPTSVIMPDAPGGTTWFQARVTGLGTSRLMARSDEGGLDGTSNPVVCTGGRDRLLWGDMHTHSIVSDGTQEPSYLYHRARDLMGWDFTAVSDHDNWSFGEERAKTPEELALMRAEAELNYAPGEFVTFQTYEWTHHVLGHRNVLFGPDEPYAFLPMTEAAYDTPAKLLEALAGRDVLVIPHHPAWKTHLGEMRFDFGPRDEAQGAGAGLQRLVEVYSRHGNSEFYGCPRPISHVGKMEGGKGKLFRAVLGKEYAGPRSGSYVRDALAAGYKFGMTAGSDEHLAGGDPRRAPTQIYGGGLSGIFAPEVTRRDAWAGLKARRVCGTTGARILMEFWVNGVAHGSQIDSDGPLHVTGHVVGSAPLERVELVKFDSKGYQEDVQECRGGEVLIDWKDPSFRENSFYYLRVIQKDGHMGWAGPTWVDYTPLGRL